MERDRDAGGWVLVQEEREGLRPRWRRRAGFAALALLLLALLILWLERRPIATSYIDRALARRGVHASYRLTMIGPRNERIEYLAIGDPSAPDLTARRIDLELRWGLSGPAIALVAARGVRLHGRLEDGQLRLGEVDRLMPSATPGGPFRLPDLDVDLADAALRLDTPAGRVGLALEGRGNLAGGFRGRLAAAAPRLAAGGCDAAGGHGLWTVAVDGARPHLAGRARLDRLACAGGLVVDRAWIGLDATLAPSLDSWRGDAIAAAAAGRFGGDGASALAGRIGFDGGKAGTAGDLRLAAARARLRGFAAGAVAIGGRYAFAPTLATFTGSAEAHGVTGGREMVAPLAGALAAARGTPLAPVARAWADALARALRGGADARADIALRRAAGAMTLRIARLGADSRSGGHLSFAGGRGVGLAWPGRAWQADGEFSLAGGGLPNARFSLSQPSPGAPLRGVGQVAPYAAGGGRLALSGIRFAATPGGGARIETSAAIDGPFSGGRIDGLVLPISGTIGRDGGFAFGRGCAGIRFRSLAAGSLRLGPTAWSLCADGPALVSKASGGALHAGARIAALRTAGTLGASPFALDAADVRLGPAGFSGSKVAIQLGPGDRSSRLDIASLSGLVDSDGLSGRYAGLSGKLADVPLLLGEGEGRWRYGGGSGLVTGTIQVADAIAPQRFMPLISRDFRLTLAGGDIRVDGTLIEPKTATRIALVRIGHKLASGVGRAQIDVPSLVFDPHFQPEQLTPLTTGIVALVRGTVTGRGMIVWDSRGVRSDGTFSTRDMNLAASFGPVEGLTTSLHFTDLLGLASAPGQIATVKAIHTGIDVFDGRIAYQLLPGLRVRLESALWPFAGGDLGLDATILDFSQPAPRQLSFRVAGMDGARFVQVMEFSNISGTGTFDGIVPMIFDDHGGRIVGGHLVARPGGGTLSYVGELTDKQLGAYGKLAFDALKSLRYHRLIVDLNGALEGEFVAGIQLEGIARNESVRPAPPGGGISGLVVGRALSQLARIPFKFTISVRGPFRAVIGTARSLQDPTNLIQSVLPQMLRDRPSHVQPPESRPMP